MGPICVALSFLLLIAIIFASTALGNIAIDVVNLSSVWCENILVLNILLEALDKTCIENQGLPSADRDLNALR